MKVYWIIALCIGIIILIYLVWRFNNEKFLDSIKKDAINYSNNPKIHHNYLQEPPSWSRDKQEPFPVDVVILWVGMKLRDLGRMNLLKQSSHTQVSGSLKYATGWRSSIVSPWIAQCSWRQPPLINFHSSGLGPGALVRQRVLPLLSSTASDGSNLILRHWRVVSRTISARSPQ